MLSTTGATLFNGIDTVNSVPLKAESHLGSGIGLAFVKSLTQLHKGGIRVYSERSEGTEIIIALPIDKADYGAAEQWEQNHEETGVRLESIHYKYEQQLPAVDRHAVEPVVPPVVLSEVLPVSEAAAAALADVPFPLLPAAVEDNGQKPCSCW
jgi:hypothetical protein